MNPLFHRLLFLPSHLCISYLFVLIVTFVLSIQAQAASAFAYAYQLLSYSHKADPFCFVVPIASSIQNVADRNRSGLQNNLSFKKVGKMSASTTSETVQKSQTLKQQRNTVLILQKKQTKPCRTHFNLLLCKVFEDIRHGYELIHVVQAPQTVADLYQKIFPVARVIQ